MALSNDLIGALQRCHSETNPQNPRSNFYAIGLHFGKKSNFSRGKSNFFGKKWLFSAKIFDDLFFFGHQLSLLHFYPLIDQKLRKQQLVPYFFSKNHLLFSKSYSKILCIFRWNLEKKQKNPSFLKTPEKTLGLLEKTQIPRPGRKTPDLGRKP